MDSTVEEGLSKDEVGRVIHEHIGEVRYCYESAMIRKADIQGKLVLDFTIGAPGNVKSAAINSSTLGDSGLDQCILSHLMKWRFPKPRGGASVAVSYPFVLKSLGK
jgi:TonB family protein